MLDTIKALRGIVADIEQGHIPLRGGRHKQEMIKGLTSAIDFISWHTSPIVPDGPPTPFPGRCTCATCESYRTKGESQ